MLRGIYSAASGMNFQIQQMDLIANNLANVETNGYKRKELLASSFGDLLVQFTNQAPGTENTIGTGVKVDGIARFETPGALIQTGNRLNVALAGDGYFLTRGTNGVEQLTRDGDFQLDAKQQLVTRAGDLVLDTRRRPITLAGDLATMKVADNGTVSLADNPIAQLMVVNPPAVSLANQFPIAPPGLRPEPNPQVKQGFLEHSNVNVVSEMVSMIEANRLFGFAQKAITAHDQILQKSANDLPRLS